MLAIVNYGVGNLYSLQSSLQYIGVDCVVTDRTDVLQEADHLILPGVGAFGDAIEKLRRNGLDQVVCQQAKSGKPLLGICLGMQLLYTASEEYGLHSGLGLVHGQISSLQKKLPNATYKVPHMGWNTLTIQQESPLFKYTQPDEYVYYVHSYYAAVTPQTIASSQYGPVAVTGAVQCGNILGTQFHPEKSGDVGLRMLKAFAEFRA